MADERGPNGERLKPNLEKRMVRLAHNIFIDCDVQVLLYFLVHRPCVLALACPRFICACAVSPKHVLCVRGVAGTRGDAPGGVLGSAAGAPKRRRHATLGTRRSPQAGRGRGHHRGERTHLCCGCLRAAICPLSPWGMVCGEESTRGVPKIGLWRLGPGIDITQSQPSPASVIALFPLSHCSGGPDVRPVARARACVGGGG